MEREEIQAVMLGGGEGLVMCGELTSSCTFAASYISISTKTLTLEIIQTHSFSTVFMDYSLDWLKGTDDKQSVNNAWGAGSDALESLY